VDKSTESLHSAIQLSTETVDNSPNLWIESEPIEDSRQFVAFERRQACG
jgi:hypothetical protein